MKPVINAALPIGSRQRNLLKKILQALHLRNYALTSYYNTWVQQKNLNPELNLDDDKLASGPLISIVVPAYNTPRRYLDQLLYSIASQSYQNWELVLVNGSTKASKKVYIDQATKFDKRIKVITVENGGISANTNEGIQATKGAYVAFVDHDDVLEPFALRDMVTAIVYEKAELIYSDEDKISDDGEIYFDPHYKPDWSPDLLTHVNYINHLTIIKKDLLEKSGLLDPTKDGAQDYDLLLRVIALQPKIVHIPKVLYHWRAAANSTAQNFSTKSNVTTAARRALEQHFKRQNIDVQVVSKADRPGFYALSFPPLKQMSVVLLPFASPKLLKMYLKLLLLSTDLKQTTIDLMVPEGAEDGLPALPPGCSIRTIKTDEEFLERALTQAKQDSTFIIGTIVLPLSRDWLSTLSGCLAPKHVACVAPIIVHGKTTIEDCGMVMYAEGRLIPLFKDEIWQRHQTFFGNPEWVRNVDAVSGGLTLLHSKELLQYLPSSKELKDTSPQNIIKEFSIAAAKAGQYNVVTTETVFDNCSIRLQPTVIGSTHFNPNIVYVNKSVELFTPESAASNILQQLYEKVSSEHAK